MDWQEKCLEFRDERPLTVKILEELGFEKNTCVDKIGDDWQDATYYTYELSDEDYVDLCLMSSYIEKGDITVELFPYEPIMFNEVGKIKMLIEALKGDE